ncbi:PREDICTED: protein fosB-like [Branchiostoma belcheri]|uniref:Protein fosB-like n=1 Tax=Branchiostoma belcheri TaxID=7741 RepID=A0A6P4Z4E4_BRABE|nr:PREDICTED: protein fosB-like [Branchiostoma belcheri]
MSGNSHIEKVPELPPPNLLAGESDVHFTAVQQHREPGSTTHPCSFHFAKGGEEEIVTRDSQDFPPSETVSSEQMSTITKDEESCRHRREKNRDAAARCRFRRRAREERLRKHTICLENANSGLRTEIARLQHELRSLSKHVMNHMELCHAGPSYTGQLTGPTRTNHVQDSSTTPQD